MKLYVTLFGVLLYLTTVKTNQDDNVQGLSDEKLVQNIRMARELGANDIIQRRKQWHSNYEFNYYFNCPDDRRDYKQDIMLQIVQLLDEILDYVRQPPRPIYMPYPIIYPVPQYCNCRANADFTEKLPVTNRNRGFVGIEDNRDGGFDDNRPISFVPIPPSRGRNRKKPRPVEHGSSQAGLNSRTQASSSKTSPPKCHAAVQSCCEPTRDKQQRRCFTKLGCHSTYANGDGCSTNSISSALNVYKNVYGVIN